MSYKDKPLLKVHDHFQGSENCVECAGRCKLGSLEHNVSALVRFFLIASLDTWLADLEGIERIILVDLIGETQTKELIASLQAQRYRESK